MLQEPNSGSTRSPLREMLQRGLYDINKVVEKHRHMHFDSPYFQNKLEMKSRLA